MAGVALSAPTRADDLANRYGGTLDEGARGRFIARIAPWHAAPDAACLVAVLRGSALSTAAGDWGLVLLSPDLAERVPIGARWVHPHASWALAAVMSEAADEVPSPDERHLAHIGEGADVAESTRVGAFAVVRNGAIVGEGCTIEPHAVIYGGVVLGRRVRVGAGAVVGRPGFGWVSTPKGDTVRVPQRGGVVVEDDVEIGPLATVDAGTLAPTRIERGAKLDAHVHVAHNVVIGPGALVAAQSGFAGSVTLGGGVLVGGQVGVADHVHVGEGARLAAKSGVIGDVPSGETYAGYPAMPRVKWLRAMAAAAGLGRRSTRKHL